MDAALRLLHHSTATQLSQSFNPCFSGCRPATLVSHQCHVNITYVSILVLVDAALRRLISGYFNTIDGVSILVLVDAALRQI